MKAARKPSTPHTRDLATIHVAANQLGIDRDTYEALLARVAGVRSAALLDVEGRRNVIAELRRLGGQRAPMATPRGKTKPGSYPGKPHNFDELPDMITKIEAQLADMNLSWAYADSIAKRMYGVQRVAWLRKPEQLKALIAALDVEQIKRARNACIDDLVSHLGMTEKDLAQLTANLPNNWRRNRRCLARVIEVLDGRRLMFDKLTGSGDSK